MMTASMSLVFFAAWTLMIVLAVASWRVTLVMMGRKKANAFPSGELHGPALYQRLCRAHANALETLAPFAALVAASNHIAPVEPLFSRAALAVFTARVFHTCVHLSGNTNRIVTVRFTFFFLQLLALAVMAWALICGSQSL